MKEYIKVDATTKKSFAVIFLIMSVLFFWLYSVQATTITSDITTDDLIVESRATVGDATSTDRFYLNARVGSSIIPTSDNILDVGEYGRTWNDIFASGTVYASSTLMGDRGFAGAPVFSFALDTDTGIFSSGANALDITAGGSAITRFNSTGIIPLTANTFDLGSYSNTWNELFASGTVYASSTLVGNGTPGAVTLGFANDIDTGWYLAAVGGPLNASINGTREYSFVTQAFAPLNDGENDLGSYLTSTIGPWGTIFSSGTVYANKSLFDQGSATDPSYSFATDTDTGFYAGNYSGATFFTSNGTGRFTMDSTRIAPLDGISLNLGRYDSASGDPWQHIFASGTIYAASSTFANYEATSTVYVKSEVASRGGAIILEDSDGSGCSVISLNNGTLTAGAITCP